MSFGFSFGDAIVLSQLTVRAYNGWKNACGDYTNITSSLGSLKVILERVQDDVRSPNSILSKSKEDFQGWKIVSADCSSVVKELEAIITKHKGLGSSRSRQKNWDRIRMAFKNLDDINRELVKKTTSISAYLTVLGLSSQGRVENELLPKLLNRVDEIAAMMRKGNSSIQSTSMTMTTVDGDDKSLWRDFRRDLRRGGFRGRDVTRHRVALQTYLGRLQRGGMLDEDLPEPFPTRNTANVRLMPSRRLPVQTSHTAPLRASRLVRLSEADEDDTDTVKYTPLHAIDTAYAESRICPPNFPRRPTENNPLNLSNDKDGPPTEKSSTRDPGHTEESLDDDNKRETTLVSVLPRCSDKTEPCQSEPSASDPPPMSTTSVPHMPFPQLQEEAPMKLSLEPVKRSASLLPCGKSSPTVMRIKSTEEIELDEKLRECLKEIELMELGIKPETRSKADYNSSLFWWQLESARRAKAILRWESRVPAL